MASGDTLVLGDEQLLSFIRGENHHYGPGIRTRPDTDDTKHNACLELEQKGLIYGNSLGSGWTWWLPVVGVCNG